MNVILHPTDFSDCSHAAFEHAVRVAAHRKTELHLLHAVVLHGERTVDPFAHFPSADEVAQRVRDAALSELSDLGSRAAAADARIEVKEVSRRGFYPAQVILEYTEEVRADLIVMGTHSRSPWKHFLLGSVTEAVMGRSPTPVLAVRQGKEETREARPPGTIVVATDFSSSSRRALETAVEWARAEEAPLDLVHVVEPPVWVDAYTPGGLEGALFETEELKEKALELLEEELERLELEGAEPETRRHVLEGHPPEEIVAHARHSDARLIVTATRGRTSWEHLLLGSTAERIVRFADCPVLVTPGPGSGD